MTEKIIYQNIKNIFKKEINTPPLLYRIENRCNVGISDLVIIGNKNIFIELKTGDKCEITLPQLALFEFAINKKNTDYYILWYNTKDKVYNLYHYSQNNNKVHLFKIRKSKETRLVYCNCINFYTLKTCIEYIIRDLYTTVH